MCVFVPVKPEITHIYFLIYFINMLENHYVKLALLAVLAYLAYHYFVGREGFKAYMPIQYDSNLTTLHGKKSLIGCPTQVTGVTSMWSNSVCI